jgi:hypothetical protein
MELVRIDRDGRRRHRVTSDSELSLVDHTLQRPFHLAFHNDHVGPPQAAKAQLLRQDRKEMAQIQGRIAQTQSEAQSGTLATAISKHDTSAIQRAKTVIRSKCD